MDFVQAAGTQSEPKKTRRIDGTWHGKLARRHKREANGAEEALGANKHDAIAATGTTRRHSVAHKREAQTRRLFGRIDGKRAEKVERLASFDAPNAADTDDVARFA